MSKITTLEPTSLTEAKEFAETLSKSGMVPEAYQGKPHNTLVAIQWGYELGLAPMQALQNIAVINGKPSIWGDSMLALVKAHKAFRGIYEYIEEDTAVCEVRREMANGEIENTRATFSIEEAKRAGLLGKRGPWQTYPNRMLKLRARGFALRDAFPDAIKGLITAEEAKDYPVAEKRPSQKPVQPPYISSEGNNIQKLSNPDGDSESASNEVGSENKDISIVMKIPKGEDEVFSSEEAFVERFSKAASNIYKASAYEKVERQIFLNELKNENWDALMSLEENLSAKCFSTINKYVEELE